MPEAPSAALRDVAGMVSQLRDPAGQDPETRSATEASLDAAVSELFGLREEAAW